MSRLEYDLLRKSEPQLRLPTYTMLRSKWGPEQLEIVARMSREQVIASRTAVLLAMEDPGLEKAHL